MHNPPLSPRFAGSFFSLCLFLFALPASAVEAPAAQSQTFANVDSSGVDVQEHELIEHELLQMVNALEQQSYHGTLTYEFGGPLETLAFEHLVSARGTQERIRHLSGHHRYFSRQLPSDYCGNAATRLFAQKGQNPLERLESFYEFRALGQNRFADRHVNMVQILPRDEFRYAFTLGIDAETHLPLMIALMGARGEILERFQFIQMAVGETSKADAEFDTSLASAAQKLPFVHSTCEPPKTGTGWHPQWLPAGFVLASFLTDGHKTAMSYTDGLASMSVFVVPVAEASGAVGVVQRGATTVAMLMAAQNQQSYKVSVVGEVPAGVAHRVASSMIYQANE